MYYLNEHLVKLNRIFDQNSRDNYIRMDLNENPGGLPEDFIHKVLSTITPELISKYPEQLAFTEKLGKFIGAELEQICLTNGSAEAVRYVIEAYSRPDGKIVSVTPSYAMYEVYANMYGRQHIPIYYNEDLTFNVNNIIERIKPDIDLLIVLNPNNPIGDVYTNEEMDRIIAAAKANEVTVLIDEAYHYFYPHSFIKYALNNDHVFITRTFSKLFSLATCAIASAKRFWSQLHTYPPPSSSASTWLRLAMNISGKSFSLAKSIEALIKVWLIGPIPIIVALSLPSNDNNLSTTSFNVGFFILYPAFFYLIKFIFLFCFFINIWS